MVRYTDGKMHVIAFTYKGRAQDVVGRTPGDAERPAKRIMSGQVKFTNGLSTVRVMK